VLTALCGPRGCNYAPCAKPQRAPDTDDYGSCLRVQIEAFYLLLNVLPKMEVKQAIVGEDVIPLLVELLTGNNETLVRQASQTVRSLCEVSQYRYMAVDAQVFAALTTGMQQITDRGARVAMVEAIGRPNGSSDDRFN